MKIKEYDVTVKQYSRYNDILDSVIFLFEHNLASIDHVGVLIE